MTVEVLTPLEHILKTISSIRSIADQMDEAEFMRLESKDDTSFRTVKNCFTELGESVKLLPVQIRNRNPEINWSGIIGMRNIIVHRYDEINLNLLWNTIMNGRLDKLEQVVQKEIERHSSHAK